MKEIRSLTGVRGVAALWVMTYHIQQKAGFFWGLRWLDNARILNKGWSGVDLFFVLSGFILVHAHGVEFQKCHFSAIVRFAKLRFVRVYPLSIVVLLLVVLLVAADPGFAAWYKILSPGNLSAAAFFQTLLLATRWFLPTYGDWNQPVWSLSAEILGYAFFPILALAVMNGRSFWLMIATGFASLAVLAAYQILTHTADLNDIGRLGAWSRMLFCFSAGAVLCRARILAPDMIAGRAAAVTWLATGVVILSLLSAQMAILRPLGFAVLIFAISFNNGAISAVLSSKVAMALGRISFPLYLLHVMPLQWLRYHVGGHGLPALSMLLILLAYVLACLTGAAILHALVEVPSHRLGRRWAALTQSAGISERLRGAP